MWRESMSPRGRVHQIRPFRQESDNMKCKKFLISWDTHPEQDEQRGALQSLPRSMGDPGGRQTAHQNDPAAATETPRWPNASHTTRQGCCGAWAPIAAQRTTAQTRRQHRQFSSPPTVDADWPDPSAPLDKGAAMRWPSSAVYPSSQFFKAIPWSLCTLAHRLRHTGPNHDHRTE